MLFFAIYDLDGFALFDSLEVDLSLGRFEVGVEIAGSSGRGTVMERIVFFDLSFSSPLSFDRFLLCFDSFSEGLFASRSKEGEVLSTFSGVGAGDCSLEASSTGSMAEAWRDARRLREEEPELLRRRRFSLPRREPLSDEPGVSSRVRMGEWALGVDLPLDKAECEPVAL